MSTDEYAPFQPSTLLTNFKALIQKTRSKLQQMKTKSKRTELSGKGHSVLLKERNQ